MEKWLMLKAFSRSNENIVLKNDFNKFVCIYLMKNEDV